jgi:hypothetical protein
MPTRLIPSPKRIAPAAEASPNKATLTSMDIELAELDGPKAGNSVESYQPRKEDEAYSQARTCAPLGCFKTSGDNKYPAR